MGAIRSSCQCCVESPTKGVHQAVATYPKAPFNGSSGNSKQSSECEKQERQVSPKIRALANAVHEGQRRANLAVKDGGFSIKSFAATNQGNIEDCYNLSKTTVGEGSFGVVKRAEDKRSNAWRAVKSIQKSATKEVERLTEEIEILSVLDHPNIIRFYESFQDVKCIYLVLELCNGGELFDRIIEVGHFTEQVAAFCIRQMFLAINYLHQNLIIHRDLKPENWLVLTRDPMHKAALKLIDFGISKRLKPGDTATSKAGTPNYVAPEVLTGRYTEKVDIWSTGVISYIMLCGQQPFTGRSTDEILASVQRGKVSFEGGAWKKISNNAKGLIKSLLQKSSSVRPSAVQVLSHAWFTTMVDASQEDPLLSKLEVDGLRAFSRMNKIKKAALTIVATQLTDARIENLKNLFVSLDYNHDGTLSVAELKQGLKMAGVKIPRDLGQVLEQVDTDGSGVLDYTEFLAATMDKKIFTQESVVWAAFRKFDVDDSGSIDVKEIVRVLGDEEMKEQMHLSDTSDIVEVFNTIDVNGDGVIDFDEFFAMVRTVSDDARENALKSRLSATSKTESTSVSKSEEQGDVSSRTVHSSTSKSGRSHSKGPNLRRRHDS